MKCPNCGVDNNAKDKYCSSCGYLLSTSDGDASQYLGEIQQFAKRQEESKENTKFEDFDLSNPTEILKAQLKMLISISRRLEKLENKDKEGVKVRVRDFDMPFWSMVGFEFKVILVAFFFMITFGCISFFAFGSMLGNLIRSFSQ
jgi:hypothetical protein